MDTDLHWPQFNADEKGISDALGFVLIFSIVVVAALTVGTVGFEQLEQAKGNEQVNNAQRAFELIEQNFNEVQRSQAESRQGEIDLRNGEIRLVDPAGTSRITVTVNGTSITETVPLNELRYSIDDTVSAYEGGALFYADKNRNEVLNDGPEIYCRQRGSNSGKAMISLVTVQGTSPKRSGGIVEVTGTHNSSRLIFPQNRTGPDSQAQATGVTIQVDSEYEDAWRTYLLSQSDGWTELAPNTYECTDSDGIEVYVRQSRLNITVSR